MLWAALLLLLLPAQEATSQPLQAPQARACHKVTHLERRSSSRPPAPTCAASDAIALQGFIRVAGGRFVDDSCREFRFHGWNGWRTLHYAVNEPAVLTSKFKAAQQAGLNGAVWGRSRWVPRAAPACRLLSATDTVHCLLRLPGSSHALLPRRRRQRACPADRARWAP